MEMLTQQMTVNRGDLVRGVFSFLSNKSVDAVSFLSSRNADNTDPANNITVGEGTDGSAIIVGTGDTTTGLWYPWQPYQPWQPQPYQPTTVPYTPPQPFTIPNVVPIEPVVLEPVQPVQITVPPAPLYDPSADTEGLIRRLEELLERAKKQQAAAATPPDKQDAAPPSATEDDSDIDAARFRRIEPKKSDVE